MFTGRSPAFCFCILLISDIISRNASCSTFLNFRLSLPRHQIHLIRFSSVMSARFKNHKWNYRPFTSRSERRDA
ncbi:hypothetical protein B0H11DRAFT_2074253 [Mycena galericulata]|nr:hypothetical protein B0H11DRAFT_2074253 [Mycena galericulata]